MDSQTKTLQVLGLTSSTFLAGIYFGSSQLTLPILYRLPTQISTSIFTELYHRGAATVVPTAILSSLCSASVAYLLPSQRGLYAAAAGLTITTLPWTAMVMMETNKRLIALDGQKKKEEVKSEEVGKLLRRWRWMNMVRSALALGGGVVAVLGLL